MIVNFDNIVFTVDLIDRLVRYLDCWNNRICSCVPGQLVCEQHLREILGSMNRDKRFYSIVHNVWPSVQGVIFPETHDANRSEVDGKVIYEFCIKRPRFLDILDTVTNIVIEGCSEVTIAIQKPDDDIEHRYQAKRITLSEFPYTALLHYNFCLTSDQPFTVKADFCVLNFRCQVWQELRNNATKIVVLTITFAFIKIK